MSFGNSYPKRYLGDWKERNAYESLWHTKKESTSSQSPHALLWVYTYVGWHLLLSKTIGPAHWDSLYCQPFAVEVCGSITCVLVSVGLSGVFSLSP